MTEEEMTALVAELRNANLGRGLPANAPSREGRAGDTIEALEAKAQFWEAETAEIERLHGETLARAEKAEQERDGYAAVIETVKRAYDDADRVNGDLARTMRAQLSVAGSSPEARLAARDRRVAAEALRALGRKYFDYEGQGPVSEACFLRADQIKPIEV